MTKTKRHRWQKNISW